MASRALKIDPKANKPAPNTAVTSSPDEIQDVTPEQISVRAYELWMERGCPHGSPEIDWMLAEEELRGKRDKRALPG